jgi:DNA-binding response OmpR family regulator
VARILIVEDEAPLARALRRGLADELHAVDVVGDGNEAMWAARSGAYDLVVLDLSLPGLSGMEVCRRLRRAGSKVPIVMLTARDAPADVVRGLDAGADDYVTKPFEFEVFLARVRAALRSRATAAASRFVVEDLVVDTARHQAQRAGEELHLTAKELALLEYLAVHRGEVVPKSRLAEALWERDCDPDSNALEVHLAALRRKLDRGRATPLLHTVRGLGYVLRTP